jgi:hypothetical protein
LILPKDYRHKNNFKLNLSLPFLQTCVSISAVLKTEIIMTIENLELANNLRKEIETLEAKLGTYNPKNKWVYLQISDHYGNKGGVIQTYMNNPKISRKIEDFIANEYGKFLENVQEKIQQEIIVLKEKLEKL